MRNLERFWQSSTAFYLKVLFKLVIFWVNCINCSPVAPQPRGLIKHTQPQQVLRVMSLIDSPTSSISSMHSLVKGWQIKMFYRYKETLKKTTDKVFFGSSFDLSTTRDIIRKPPMNFFWFKLLSLHNQTSQYKMAIISPP